MGCCSEARHSLQWTPNQTERRASDPERWIERPSKPRFDDKPVSPSCNQVVAYLSKSGRTYRGAIKRELGSAVQEIEQSS